MGRRGTEGQKERSIDGQNSMSQRRGAVLIRAYWQPVVGQLDCGSFYHQSSVK